MLKYVVVLIMALSPTTVAFSASPWLAAYCQGAPLLRCQLSRVTTVIKVVTNDRGTLFRVEQQSCFKDYRNGRHPKIYDCQSTDIGDVSDVAIYCSSDRPTIARRGDRDDGWNVSRLSFDDENDFHSVHWDNRLYFLVCHNYDIGEQSNIAGFDKLSKRFGYHPIDLSKSDENTKVKTIEELAADR